MKKILVTGGAGFIGSHFIEKVLSDAYDYEVICIDNFDDFLYDPRLKRENIQPFLDNKKFTLYEYDIRDFEKIKEVFEKHTPNYIVHIAAKADARKALEAPLQYASVNVDATLNLLELAKEYKVENFVLASSSSVYGNTSKPPFREDVVADRPLSPYGATKRATEILAYTYYHNYGLNVTCLRYFNVYGERMRPKLVHYKWIENILNNKTIELSGDGGRERDYTYIGDIISGTIKAMEKPLGFEIINLGNKNPVSLRELLSIIEKELGMKADVKTRPSHHASVEKTFADVSKAKKLLDWEPKVSLEEGIAKLVTWFRKERLGDSK